MGLSAFVLLITLCFFTTSCKVFVEVTFHYHCLSSAEIGSKT